jgi:hypothetical protein
MYALKIGLRILRLLPHMGNDVSGSGILYESTEDGLLKKLHSHASAQETPLQQVHLAVADVHTPDTVRKMKYH